MTRDVSLTADERRILRNALRGYSACPVVDRDKTVTLLYKLEHYETEARKK